MSAQPPRHVPIQFDVVDDCLVVGGIALTRLAAQVGQTPFYAYDRGQIDARVAALRNALPREVSLHYAMKANPMPALVAHMVRRVDGIDVASGRELRVALDAGADPREVSFAGPGKSEGELRQAVAAGICSMSSRCAKSSSSRDISASLGLPARVALRINPDFELKTSGMKMGGGPKQFGVDAEQVPDVLRRVGQVGLGFEGFHIYAGSQNLKADSICDAQTKSFDLAFASRRRRRHRCAC